MRLRLAAPDMAALMAVLVPGCGEAIDDPRPADATERQVLPMPPRCCRVQRTSQSVHPLRPPMRKHREPIETKPRAER